MSRTSGLGQWTGLPVLGDAADITQVGTTMADAIEKQVNLRYATTAARDTAITSPVRGMVVYIDADNSEYLYTGSAWTLKEGPAYGALTTYTPVVTQSGVVTCTVNLASYQRTGRMISGNVLLTVTGGAGVAVNAVQVTLPINSVGTINATIGNGYIFDTSASALFQAVPNLRSATQMAFLTSVAQLLGANTFTAALAVGDIISFDFHYEAAAD